MNLDLEMLDAPERPTLSVANLKVLSYIESIFKSIGHAIQENSSETPQVNFRRITSLQSSSYVATSGSQWNIGSCEVKYCWPGKTEEEARKFSCVCQILMEIYSAIQEEIVITKRDIFYHRPDLFQKQTVVDQHVDDIAFTCGVTRRDLNVTASPKGLFSCPYAADKVLVVEKEASFKTLVQLKMHATCRLGIGLLITGRGYPDLATRRFLRAVLDHNKPQPPVYGLFDGDPDGIEILKCYCIGSKRLAQEMACNIPELKWLGLSVNQLLRYTETVDALIPLTPRDRSKAKAMLARPDWQEQAITIHGMSGCRSALQQMLMLNKKAEIQALGKVPGGVTRWLEERMSERR